MSDDYQAEEELPEGQLQFNQEEYQGLGEALLSPEGLALVVLDLEAALQRAKDEVADAIGLYDSEWWDFLYRLVAEAMQEFSRAMTFEIEPAKIYRAQGAYTGLQDLVNELIDLKDGKVKGTTITELEEEYERRNQELDDIS